MKKGQLAHLDSNNENASEDNLVFLCLEHHDEYDSTPRLSKGLREAEVRRWRNELYKEMEYRFRTVKQPECQLVLARLTRTSNMEGNGQYCGEFRLRNTGEAEICSPTVSIRLHQGYYAQPSWHLSVPPSQNEVYEKLSRLSMKDARSDLFEPEGRIATIAPASILLRNQSVTFFGLHGNFPSPLNGTTVSFDYRIDAVGMSPVTGILEFRYATEASELGDLRQWEL